jgi:hypothetical protein
MSGSSVPPAAADVVPRLHLRDPDAWLRLFACLVIAFSAAQVLAFSFGRDQGIYAMVGEGMVRGEVPYRDLWDFKPPGIFLVYGVAQGIFGKSMLAPRLLEVIGMVVSVWCCVRLAQMFFGSRTVGYVSGAVASLIHAQLDFWHSGQPETFAGVLTLLGLVATAYEGKRQKRGYRFVLVGVLFGCAALLKPPLGGGAIVCAAYLSTREQMKHGSRRAFLLPVVAVGAGAVLPVLATLAWFWAKGGLDAMYWTLGKFTPGYTSLSWVGRDAPEMLYYALEEAFFRFSALAAAGVIAAVGITPMHGREREGIFLVLGVIALQVTGIAMQGKFFQYHYGATLPLVSFIAGLGLYKLFRRCLAGGAGGVLAFAAFLGVTVAMRQAVRDLPQGFWERSGMRLSYLVRRPPFERREALDQELGYVADYNLAADREVSLEVRARTRPDQPIYIWGFEPVIYWLADRTPSSRFIYDVPQRTMWERDYARRELLADLKRRPPALIVVQQNDVFHGVTGDDLDSRRALPTFAELDQLVSSRYELVRTIEDFQIYALTSQPR